MRHYILVAAVLMAACGGSDRDPDQHLLEPHQEALEKARAVEDQVLKATERRRREIDEQE